MKLSFNEFTLMDAIFEARYKNGWLIWDKVGEIWSSMTSHYPELQMVTAQPVVTTFKRGTTQDFSIETEKMLVRAHRPGDSLPEFPSSVKHFVETVAKSARVTEFTRLGLRLIFAKSYSSIEEASKAMLATGVVNFASNRRFGMQSPAILFPEAAIRLEDKDVGVGVRFNALQITTSVEFPYGWEGSSSEAKSGSEQWGFFIDVDAYTKSLVAIDHLKIDEWISMKHRQLRKELESMLGAL